MLKIVAVMIDGAVNSLNRYLRLPVTHRAGSPAIDPRRGFFKGPQPTDARRLFIFTGFSGGFTTFSAFVRKTAGLFIAGAWRSAGSYPGRRPVCSGHCPARRARLAT